MPTLLRSYAIYRSWDENYVGDPSRIGTAFKTWRMCVEDGNAVRQIPEHVCSLRTLMVLGGSSSSPRSDADDGPPSLLMDVISQRFTSLRVLDIRDTQVETVESILERLVQIRYLNLSNTRIEALPPEVRNLVVLQFLILKRCRRLTSLPAEVGRLNQLRSLDISETPMLRDILFNQLGNLKELRCFRGFRPVVAGNNNNNGWTFGELSNLSNLTSLHILKLGRSTSSQEAGRLKLIDKTGLKDLELCCTIPVSEPLDDVEDARLRIGRVFDALKPPEHLTSLKIAYFYGTELPSWVSPSHLTRLRRLTLHGCTNCQRLPRLGDMRNLKLLALEGFNALPQISDELLGLPGNGVAFSRLEHLSLANMQNLEAWSGLEARIDVPMLRRFEISQCPKLRRLPPWLQHCTALTSLKALRADRIREIKNLPVLKELELERCGNLDRISNLSRLLDLKIVRCSRLRVVQGVPLLRSLRLHEETTRLPQWLCQKPSSVLKTLEIVGVEELLYKCSPVGFAPYGPIIKNAADYVYAELEEDGSMYFSYTPSTCHFQRSPRYNERAHSYSAVTLPHVPAPMSVRLLFYFAVLIAVQCFIMWSWTFRSSTTTGGMQAGGSSVDNGTSS